MQRASKIALFLRRRKSGRKDLTMNFKDAFKAMKEGKKVKLPSWAGYWAWENGTIMMHCKDGAVIDLRETERPEYTFDNIASDKWILADKDNTPVLGGTATFGFGDAIKYIKRGLRVKRQGWNGKNQYIELAKEISYLRPDGWKTGAVHMDIGSQAIAFVGARGTQIGWLASQADMLANDWMFVD